MSTVRQLRATEQVLAKIEERQQVVLENLGRIIAAAEAAKRALDELPSSDTLDEVATSAGQLCTNLELANDSWENAPTLDDIDELSRSAANLASNLSEAAEMQR